MKKFLRYFKDPMSGLTHFVGALLAIAGLVVLVVKASLLGKPWHIVSYSIFGAGMILLYTASTLYHWIPVNGKAERALQKMDHIMIYVLIAATYTPVCLIPLRGGWGWSLFGVAWGIATVGILLKIFWNDAPRWFSPVIYVLIGWTVIIGIVPLVQTLQPGAVAWLFAGGISYTVGVVIFATNRPRLIPAIFGAHELFHVLVMFGTFSHFWVMYRYIMVFD